MSDTKATVDLTYVDGNAFSVLGTVTREMKRQGFADQVPAFMEEATSGDYDHLLQTVHKYVDVDFQEL